MAEKKNVHSSSPAKTPKLQLTAEQPLTGECWSEVKSLSHVQLFVTPWNVAYQAPLSMGFSRQECWSGLPFPSPGDLPNPGINPRSPALQADALPSEPWIPPKKDTPCPRAKEKPQQDITRGEITFRIKPGSPTLQADALPSEPFGRKFWNHPLGEGRVNELGTYSVIVGKQ